MYTIIIPVKFKLAMSNVTNPTLHT